MASLTNPIGKATAAEQQDPNDAAHVCVNYRKLVSPELGATISLRGWEDFPEIPRTGGLANKYLELGPSKQTIPDQQQTPMPPSRFPDVSLLFWRAVEDSVKQIFSQN